MNTLGIRGALAAALSLPLLLISPAAQAGTRPAVGSTTTASVACSTSLTGAERARLATLSDPAGVQDLATARDAITQIADILVPHRDYRGMFAIFYRDILTQAIPSIEAGGYRDVTWVRRISMDFVLRYLGNLHAAVTGGTPTPAWQNFYRRAATCQGSPGRVIMAGLTAHLMVDFPESVRAVGSTSADKGDFFAIGDQLVATTPTITRDIRAAYSYDLDPFFRLWLASDIADPWLGGPGQTTYYFFQGIRSVAWVNGLALNSILTRPLVRARILAEWAGAEVALDGLSAVGKL